MEKTFVPPPPPPLPGGHEPMDVEGTIFSQTEDISMRDNPLSDFESEDETEGLDFQPNDVVALEPHTDIPSTEIKVCCVL